MFGLVLGGGGAKGYAHIGVIRVMEELGIKPDLIVGASMGSLVGGFYAAGFDSHQIEKIAVAIDKRKKRWLFPFCLSKKGFIDGKRVVRFLSQYLGGKKIESLPAKFAAVATDIETCEEIIIDQGDLISAIRASISIPAAFIPYPYAGRILIDGGFANPVPMTVAEKMGATKIIAVNVLTKHDYPQVFLTSKKNGNRNHTIKTILTATFDLISSRLIDYERSRTEDHLLINVDTSDFDMTRFENARNIINLGYRTAVRNIDRIKVFMNFETHD